MVQPLRMRALSVRQPFAELIVSGRKAIEYRSRRTHIRGRVYIYACKAPSKADDYKACGLEPGALVHGALVGTVEIVDCFQGEDGYEWQLANPKRLNAALTVKAIPQPGFFLPFG